MSVDVCVFLPFLVVVNIEPCVTELQAHDSKDLVSGTKRENSIEDNTVTSYSRHSLVIMCKQLITITVVITHFRPFQTGRN